MDKLQSFDEHFETSGSGTEGGMIWHHGCIGSLDLSWRVRLVTALWCVWM